MRIDYSSCGAWSGAMFTSAWFRQFGVVDKTTSQFTSNFRWKHQILEIYSVLVLVPTLARAVLCTCSAAVTNYFPQSYVLEHFSQVSIKIDNNPKIGFQFRNILDVKLIKKLSKAIPCDCTKRVTAQATSCDQWNSTNVNCALLRHFRLCNCHVACSAAEKNTETECISFRLQFGPMTSNRSYVESKATRLYSISTEKLPHVAFNATNGTHERWLVSSMANNLIQLLIKITSYFEMQFEQWALSIAPQMVITSWIDIFTCTSMSIGKCERSVNVERWPIVYACSISNHNNYTIQLLSIVSYLSIPRQ